MSSNDSISAEQAGKLPFNKSSFGKSFKWGVSVAAYQIEGASDLDGKGKSIWDEFTTRKGKIKGDQHGNLACDFYNRLENDIDLLKSLNIPHFRFSISWSRVMPTGQAPINWKGVEFYNKLINTCLACGIEPWVTLYHWDLPLVLELKGGWANRDVINWFGDFTSFCAKQFGDRVKYWMVINEPMVFTGAGYFLGVHAPGKKGLKNFLPAVHHATLCLGEGGRILRNEIPDAEIGTTFSCTHIDSYSQSERDLKAANRVDTLLNRLFIEPVLGLGYPLKDLTILSKLEKYILPGDDQKLKFDFDFIGVQNYTREIIKHSFFTPYLFATVVNPKKRKVTTTLMNWEVYPESIYHILKKFNAYPQIKKLIVTENGAAFSDTVSEGKVKDDARKKYLQDYLAQVLRAKNEGVKVDGYFVWTFMDNFEWAEGYHPRFGIVHVDFETQERIPKSSGLWYKQFLSE